MLAIIQTRFNSERLPGKALLKLGNTEMLGRCVQRVSAAKSVSNVLIATSENKTDIPIVEFCQKRNFAVHLGPLEDVGLRLLRTANAKKKASQKKSLI